MSVREWVSPYLAERSTSDGRRDRRRRAAEHRRQRAGAPHRLYYYHQQGDPYSALTAQLLPGIVELFDLELIALHAPPPPVADAPEPDKLHAFAQADAAALARHYALARPTPAERTQIAALLAQPTPTDQVEHRRRRQHKHFAGALFHYGGENYWNIDRVHYLLARLVALGAQRAGVSVAQVGARLGAVARAPAEPALAPHAGATATKAAPAVDFYASLRSPYTYLVAERLYKLADSYGVPVRLRPVRPMMMRGVPASVEKQRYFVFDCKREATRLGLPFGRIADPFGKPALRGMCLQFLALRQGKERAYLLSFLRGVWSEGIRAGSDRGLRKIAERAGLDWQECRQQLALPARWEEDAEHNRQALASVGHWGVPTLSYGDLHVWGQDRLWRLAERLASS